MIIISQCYSNPNLFEHAQGYRWRRTLPVRHQVAVQKHTGIYPYCMGWLVIKPLDSVQANKVIHGSNQTPRQRLTGETKHKTKNETVLKI